MIHASLRSSSACAVTNSSCGTVMPPARNCIMSTTWSGRRVSFRQLPGQSGFSSAGIAEDGDLFHAIRPSEGAHDRRSGAHNTDAFTKNGVVREGSLVTIESSETLTDKLEERCDFRRHGRAFTVEGIDRLATDTLPVAEYFAQSAGGD